MRQIGTFPQNAVSITAPHTSIGRWTFVSILMLAAVLGICLPGLQLGFGSHGDSRAVFEASVAAILNGHYAPSRSYGVPLYEFVAAALQPLGGTLLVNVYSLVLSLFAIVVFAHLLASAASPAKSSAAPWALAGFALNPLFLINASSPTEWAQANLFLVCALSCVVLWLRTQRLAPLAAYSVCICGLVLSRPDFAVVCVAIGVAILWELKLARFASLLFIASTVAAAVVTLSIYMLLNGGPGFFLRTGEMVGDQIGVRRTIVALVGIVDVFGIAGCIALIVAFGGILMKRRAGADLTFYEKLTALIWPIMLVRFAMLPDKLEYVFPLIPITLLAVASRRQSTMITAVVAGSLILNSVVAVSFFERSDVSDTLTFSVRLNKGAVLQDWDARNAQSRALDPAFAARLAAAVDGESGAASTHLYLKNFYPGFTDDQDNLVLSKEQYYKLNNPRFTDPRYARKNYGRVYVCDGAFISDNIGWRVLQPPPVYASFDAGGGSKSVQCRPE